MAGNVPNVSVDSYNFDKVYDQVVLQQGVPIVDSDWNEQGDVRQMDSMLTSMYALGNGAFPAAVNSLTPGYQISEAAAPENDFTIGGGWLNVYGVLVPTTVAAPPIDHDYEDDSNILCEGIVSAISGGAGTITDQDKNWESFYNLAGCRVKMTSGAESGNSFTISVHTSATTVELSGGIGSIGTTDEFIIKPPALTTPGAPRTDKVYAMVWFADINENEDSAIVNAGVAVEASHRRQRQWCVRVAEGLSTPSTPDQHSFGVRYLELATLSRTSADIITAEISNTVDAPLSLSKINSQDFTPSADDVYDLGSATNQWKNLYVDGIAYLDTISLGTTAGEGFSSNVVPSASATYGLGSDGYRWKSLWISEVAGDGVGTDLNPDQDNRHDLGSATYRWSAAYFRYLNVSDDAFQGCTSNFVPATTLIYDLGDSTRYWGTVYARSVHLESATSTDTVVIDASGTGKGIDISNSSTDDAISISCTSTGDGIDIYSSGNAVPIILRPRAATTGTVSEGSLYYSSVTGKLMLCTTTGDPGTWETVTSA